MVKTKNNDAISIVDDKDNVSAVTKKPNRNNQTTQVEQDQTQTQQAQTPISNDSTINAYQSAVDGFTSANANVPQNSLTEANTNANDSKISSANTLLQNYLSQAQSTQSAKVQAYMAQQEANNNLKNYLTAQGLGSQGVSESAMAQANNNYVNSVNGINATANATNANSYDNYLDALNNIDATKNSEIAEVQNDNYTISATQMSSATTQDEIDKYLSEAQNQLSTGEISQTQYNQINSLYEAQSKQLENNSIGNLGVADDGNGNYEAVDLTTLSKNKNYKDDGRQTLALNWLAQQTSSSLSNIGVINGTVVDMNWGRGTDNYVYYNGKWYKTDAEKTKNTLSISDLYNTYK